MQNLREQLLKAGIINEDQAKKAEKETSSPRRPPPRSPARQGTARPQAGPPKVPKLPPLALPNNREHQRLEAKRQVERDRQIRGLVLAAQLPTTPEGEQTFYFVTRKNKLRRLQLSPEVARRLESGELAVVERPDPGQIEHAVVPAEVALQVLALQEKSVRFFNRGDQPVGFLSDEELARRQRQEASEAAEAEAPREEYAKIVTVPEEPEDAGPEVEPEPISATESIARNAERAAPRVSSEDGDQDG